MLRSKDAGQLNYFLNHSKIKPFITQDGDPDYIDGTEILAKPDTHFMVFPYGCWIFWKTGASIYTADCYFLPRNRGAWAKEAGNKAFNYMFSVTEADRIVVEVPACNKPSQVMAGSLNFRRVRTKPACWQKNGILHDVIVYELTRKDHGFNR